MRLCFLSFLFVLGAVWVSPVHAQNSAYLVQNDPYAIMERHTRYALLYNRRMQNIIAQREERGIDFQPLTSAYVKTEYYAPDAQEIADQLYTYAFTAQKAESNNSDNIRATLAFQDLVSLHLPNIDVVTSALSLVQSNKDLSENSFLTSAFLQRTRDGLLRRLYSSGTGNTVDSPYKIISLGEEAFIFKSRNFKPVHTEELEARGRYINIHLVEDIKTGQPWKIYTDISAPIEYNERMEILRKPDIRFQRR